MLFCAWACLCVSLCACVSPSWCPWCLAASSPSTGQRSTRDRYRTSVLPCGHPYRDQHQEGLTGLENVHKLVWTFMKSSQCIVPVKIEWWVAFFGSVYLCGKTRLPIKREAMNIAKVEEANGRTRVKIWVGILCSYHRQHNWKWQDEKMERLKDWREWGEKCAL